LEGLKSLGILGPNLLFHIVNFLVVLFILNRVLYRPVLKMFGERSERIRQGLAEAERVREEAAAERQQLENQLADERRESQERLRDAVSKSEEAAKRRLAEASTEADQIIAKARTDAEEARKEALAGLHGEIGELALLAASKVLREELDEDRHRALINRFLEEDLGELA
jgi:F-type H+-transporting ATPase subunit b